MSSSNLHSTRTGTVRVIAIVSLVVAVPVLLVAAVGYRAYERRDARATDTTPEEPGTSFHVLTVDGRDRSYTIHVPTDLPTGPVPLVLGLHGGIGSGQQFENANHMDTVADDQGFIAVYPDGIEGRVDIAGTGSRTWNAGHCCGRAADEDVDDVAFIEAVIAEVEVTHDIDSSRVVAIGHSNGGMLAYRLACEASDKITGVAVYGSTLEVDTCAPVRPVSLLAVHGSDDVNVPYEGGEGQGLSGTDYRSVSESVESIVAVDGCDPDAALGSRVQQKVKTWSGCDDDTTVEHVVLVGATHAWPGGEKSARLTDTSVGFDASAVMAAWLIGHPRTTV